MDRAAVIVAGGRSERFGDADKAVADLAGTPMVRRVADRLASVVDELVVNCRPDQVEAISEALSGYPHPVTYAEDGVTDQGPMAGIGTGLRAVDAEYAVVVACDMPFLDPGFLAHLFERAAGHDAAVPRLGEYYEPIHAVYRAAAMADACEAALAGGSHRVIAPFEYLEDIAVVEEAEVERHGSRDSFRNLNTRAEVAAAAAEFDGDTE